MFVNIYLVLFCLFIRTNSSFRSTLTINVNETNVSQFKHFWKSTGYCPPDPKEKIGNYFLTDEQKTYLALLGSLPINGIQYVRIHWLLNLLSSKRLVNDVLSYNFTNLDTFLSILTKNDLYPGFEIMGCSNHLVTFEKSKQFWLNLVQQIATRYIEIFGSDRVSKWRFETWNEPDLKNYNCLNFSYSEYLDYVSGANEGLKSSFSLWNSAYNFGGPAGLFKDKNHPLCWGVLEYCSSTPTEACPLKYISFHRKGGGSSQGVLNGTLSLIDDIFEKFPTLRPLPVSNDEADIETNWSVSRDWRGDVRYPIMIIRVIAEYYKSVKLDRKLKLDILSNDNGFLNYHPFYFTQRTLFARFQINTTTPVHSQFIKKPVYSLMALLSFLGEAWIPTPPAYPDPLLTTIATRSTQHKQSFVSVVLAYGNETYEDALQEKTAVVNLNLEGFDNKTWRFLIYKLDNIDTNPFKTWKNMSSPVFPSVEQRQILRRVEAPQRLFDPTDVLGSYLNLTLSLNMPSIHLIHACAKTDAVPKKVQSVTVYNVTWNEAIIIWKYPYKSTKCLLKYEVEFKAECSGSSPLRSSHFKRINPLDTPLFMSFHQVGQEMLEFQDVKNDTVENVRVFIRVRPLKEKENTVINKDVVRTNTPLVSLNKRGLTRTFKFCRVFDGNCNQLELYRHVAVPIVERVLQGYNGTIFAYGQSGTGKTYTMIGDVADPEKKGIIPNIFSHIFAQITLANNEYSYAVTVTYLEIYNEEIRDLLSDTPEKKLSLRERPGIGVYVTDLLGFTVDSLEGVTDILIKGNKHRATSYTKLNDISSRSHAIFTIIVESKNTKTGKTTFGKLNLVDLAGSERVDKTQATGDRLREAGKINLSLSVLGNVISALVDGKASHIPYRNSKLTRMLQDSLGGNSLTAMIAMVSPRIQDCEESMYTLMYADRVRHIQNHVTINIENKSIIETFEMKIEELKEELRLLELREEREEKRARKRSKTSLTQEEFNNIEKEKSVLENKIHMIQKKILVGGENLIEKAQQQMDMLEDTAKELQHLDSSHQLLEEILFYKEKEKTLVKREYANLQEEDKELDLKIEEAEKLVKKATEILSNKENEYQNEICTLLQDNKNLAKEMSLVQLIVKHSIPEEYLEELKNGIIFDEETQEWQIKGIAYCGNNLRKIKACRSSEKSSTESVYFQYPKKNKSSREGM